MVVFVGTSPFRRITLWVAMESIHLNIARIFFPWDSFFGHALGPHEQFDTYRNLA